MAERTIPAALDKLDEALDFVHTQLAQAACPPRTLHQIDLAVEEIFVNIARYAYHPALGTVTITCTAAGAPPYVTLVFADRGRPYDPLERDDPDLALDAEQRQIGGLGIWMVKQLMDEIRYEYRDGQNILTMRKRL